MITFDRPLALLFLPLILTASVFSAVFFRRLTDRLGLLWAHRPKIQKQYLSLKRIIVLKNLFWTTGFICMLIAYAGPYWGTKPKTIQTSGHSVSFVFDISYSMMAQDMPSLTARTKKSSRLAYAAEYASQLLKRLNGIPVSVVLAKGNGMLAVPSTDDYFAVESLLSSLSPQLMSSAGSDLGEGILTAIRSFPTQSAAAASIILFTDGDETVQTLENAIAEAARYGISLVIAGFGSLNETEITAGDGVTRVKSALREQNLKKIVSAVSGKNTNILYVNALDTGSAISVLNVLQPAAKTQRTDETTAYGEEDIPRFMVFLCTALFFFIIGLVIGELRITKRTNKTRKITIVSLVLLCLLCTSCTAQFKAPFELLTGILNWNRKNYDRAVASFLHARESAIATENTMAEQYAQFALGSAYLMQNENAAATERFRVIPSDAPEAVLSGMWYNSGIIAHREGNYQLAADCFKNVLLLDSSNLNAKINLELSMQQAQIESEQSAREMLPINEKSENNTIQDTVFSIIKENEQNQWKSQPNQNTQKNIIDY